MKKQFSTIHSPPSIERRDPQMSKWPVKKLGEVVDTIGGLWKGKKEPFETACVYSMKNMTKESDQDYSTSPVEIEVEVNQFAKRRLLPGDLLLEKSGGGPNQPVGRVIVIGNEVEPNASFTNFTARLRLKNVGLAPNFLQRFLKYQYISGETEKYQSNSTNIRNLQVKDYLNLPIPVPPLEEQERIVGLLDQAFAAIDTATAQIQQQRDNTQELFASSLESAFGENSKWRMGNEKWVETTLGQVSENLDSRRVPITKNKRKPGLIPYYGASGIVDHVEGYLFDEDLLLVSEDGANLLARTYPIAFSVAGKTWVNNHAHVLRFQSLDEQKFMEYYLNSISLEPFVSGMAQPKINQKALKSIPVPAPPLPTQRAIVTELDALSAECTRLQNVYQSQLDAWAELKQSLLAQAFSGDL